jgi:hypothetical protein
MKWIKRYSKFVESIKFDLSIVNIDINESLSIWFDSLLDSIGAKEVDIFDTFKLPKDDYIDRLDLEYLSDNIEFINSLSSIGMKKSNIQNSDDFETFINKPCRFMFIYNVESNELENPNYLLIQGWNETLKKWDESKLYTVNDDVKKFYDKLSSKVIEVDDNGEKYIYSTSNGNEYILQNTEKENDTFKKYLRKEDFENLINDKGVKIKVI